jgi:hypothetical protein
MNHIHPPDGKKSPERLLERPSTPSTPVGGLPCNFLDESLHRYSLCDKACSCLIHRLQQAPPCFIDPRNLCHVDFDPSAGDQCRTPGAFGFGNPSVRESAGKM